MLSPAMKTLILCASAAVALCGCNRVETQLAFPNASDLRPSAEPEYPLAALGDGDAAKAAEDAWWNDVLAWGRTEHGKVLRVCEWAVTMGKELPAGWCAP